MYIYIACINSVAGKRIYTDRKQIRFIYSNKTSYKIIYLNKLNIYHIINRSFIIFHHSFMYVYIQTGCPIILICTNLARNVGHPVNSCAHFDLSFFFSNDDVLIKACNQISTEKQTLLAQEFACKLCCCVTIVYIVSVAI